MRKKNRIILLSSLLMAALFYSAIGLATTPLEELKKAKTSEQYAVFKQQCETINRQFKWRFQKPEGNKNLNLTNKKSFEAAVPQKMIEQLVGSKRQQESALKNAFGIEINKQQLQTELQRMVRESLQPERLKQLFSAFGNDADLIAECVARPYLTQKALKNKFAFDQTIHKGIKNTAEIELTQYLGGNKSLLKGRIHSVLFTQQPEEDKSTAADTNTMKPGGMPAKQSVISPKKWDQLKQQLNKNKDKSNRAADLLFETDDVFYAMKLIDEHKGEMEIEFISWPKLSLNQWLKLQSVSFYVPKLSATLQLPKINNQANTITPQPQDDNKSTAKGSALDPGYWRIMTPGATEHDAVWTGTEMLVWGGYADRAGLPYFYAFPTNMGSRYDPVTDQWTLMSTVNRPDVRLIGHAVWSGSELLVWGGIDASSRAINSGARYNPLTDTWTPISDVNAPTNYYASVIWTGTEMITWGGWSQAFGQSAGAYNPETDTWRSVSTIGAVLGLVGHSLFWTGSEMIVWGGGYNNGGRYNPVTDSWTTIPFPSGHVDRSYHQAISTSKGMMVFGGSLDGAPYEIYDYENDQWLDLSPPPDFINERLTVVSLGDDKVMAWGRVYSGFETRGAIYDVENDTWTEISDLNKPQSRKDFTMVFTGEEVIIWGGLGQVDYSYASQTINNYSVLSDGARYNLSTDQWQPVRPSGPTRTKIFSSAIWTGAEMILWGGFHPESQFITGDPFSNEGHLFNPVTSAWAPISQDVPLSPRYYANSIWNGDEMLIWGGNNGTTYFNDGARYDPLTDSWQVMSPTGSPVAGFSAFMAWMDDEMLVITHDGGGPTTPEVLSGAMYNPDTDLWRPMNVAGAPTRFSDRTKGRWNGSELYVGGFLNGDFPHGAVFYPNLNQWFPLNRTANHEPKHWPATAMIGNEFIVASGQGYHSGGASTSGEIYNTETGVWRPMSETDAFGTTSAYLSVWTGEDLILWGERYNIASYSGNGGKYNFATDTWVNILPEPSMRFKRDNSFTSVWADNVMLIWGGEWTNIAATNHPMGNNISAYYPVGYFQPHFTAHGLAPETEVHLSDDQGNNYVISANGDYSLAGQYPFHEIFYVYLDQTNSGTRGDPLQDCYLIGMPGSAGVTTEHRELMCENRAFAVNGTVTGLLPSNNLILEIDSLSPDILVSQDGTFTFSPGVPDQKDFVVNIKRQPQDPLQNCNITLNTGTINAAPASGVTVVCEPSTDLIFKSGFESTGEGL